MIKVGWGKNEKMQVGLKWVACTVIQELGWWCCLWFLLPSENYFYNHFDNTCYIRKSKIHFKGNLQNNTDTSLSLSSLSVKYLFGQYRLHWNARNLFLFPIDYLHLCLVCEFSCDQDSDFFSFRCIYYNNTVQHCWL